MSQTVCVQTFPNEFDAEIAKDLLQANGIKATIVADDAGGMFVAFRNEIKLVVMEEDAELAREILATRVDEPSEPEED